MAISPASIIKPQIKVKFGKDPEVEDFCIIGEPPKDTGTSELHIGDNARIRSHTVIYAGNKIGDNFLTGHYALIRENNRIGNNVLVGSYSHVAFGCVIEDDVRIHTGVYIFENTCIGKGARLAPGVRLANDKYPGRTGKEIKGPDILEGAVIGMGAIIGPGVKIGKGAVIGMGSVVTKNVPANEIWMGNPARFYKKTNELGYILK